MSETAEFGRRIARAQGQDPEDRSVDWEAYGRHAQERIGLGRPVDSPAAFRAAAPAAPKPSPPRSSPGRSAAAARSLLGARPQQMGRLALSVASAPVQAGRGLGTALSGGDGDSAVGRLLAAVVVGAVVLEMVSLFTGNFFDLQLQSPWPAKVTTSPAAAGSTVGDSPPAGPGSTPSQNRSQGATGPQGTAPHTRLG